MSLDWLPTELSHLADAGLRRQRRVVQHLPNGRCKIDDRTVINFGTNDYLGLTSHPSVQRLSRWWQGEEGQELMGLGLMGTGAGASPLVTGRTVWHQALESALAKFEGTTAAILFPSGYAANVGTIGALVGAEDVVCCDRLNHASLIDGCRLSRAKFLVYPHRDIAALDEILKKQHSARRRLIVTDSLFSMDGDIAPLAELADLAERHDAMLLVDEAHATGLFGAHGRGLAELAGIESHRCVIRVGTLSKAVGAQGGFVAGSQELIDWLFNSARTQMFSTALSPVVCGAAIGSLLLIEKEPHRREHLAQLSADLRAALLERGIIPMPDCTGPIIPILIGDANRAVQISRSLEEQGFFVPAIRPPTVPADSSRLRISLSASLSSTDVISLAEAIAFTISPQ